MLYPDYDDRPDASDRFYAQQDCDHKFISNRTQFAVPYDFVKRCYLCGLVVEESDEEDQEEES